MSKSSFKIFVKLGVLVFIAGLLFIPVAMAAYTPPANNRADLDLNSTWKFNKSDVAGAEGITFNDSSWSAVNLPHTWNNSDGQDGGNNYYRGIGWYRKHYTVNSSYSGRKFFLQFDGANIVTDVYFNGNYLGQHKGGFAAFRFEVTQYVNIGADNVIAVKVNNAYNADVAPLSADFTFFGGLYRSVHLLVTDKLAVRTLDYASPGIYLKQTNVSSASADLQVTAKTFNSNTTSKNVTLNAVIVDAAGNAVKTLTSTQTVAANTAYDFVLSTTLTSPHLWNGLSDPYLYRVYVEVKDGSIVTDLVDQPLGFRYYSVDPNNGFYLNGGYLDLHGVNRHQDRLGKGWAIGNAEHLEDFNLIKEMGCNAIRLAHYQHAQYFYDLCDTNGMVVWAEIPLVNSITESTAFYDNCKQQMTELIRQNYNHPAIFFWGIHNEVTLNSGPDPNTLLQQLADLVVAEDPTRLSTCASCAGNSDASNWHTNVTDFNKYFGWYTGAYTDFGPWADGIHSSYPTKMVGVSEYGAGSSINFHSESPVKQDHTEEYQNLFHESHWLQMKTRKFLWSKFIWNMFDFAADARNEGDTPGRNDKGMVTYDRQTRKDSFYWYKANWTTSPFVYITSRRFTNRTNGTTEVKIYSNCDSVELKVNGVSRGIINATGDKIFKWTGVALASGSNTIDAIGTKNSTQYTDTCSWTLTAAPLSQGKTATASSFQTGNEVAKGNDGNISTRWAAVDATYPQWWKVDLGASYNLNKAVINWYNSSSRAYKYKIEVSSDNSTFTTVVDKTGNTTYGDTTDTFTATGKRYVRITVTGCTTTTAYASAFEFKIYNY